MRRLPVFIVATCLVAIVAALLIPPTAYSEWLITFLFAVFAAAYVLVGGLIATRRSQNPIGWLMLGIGALFTIPLLLGAYAGYALLENTSLPFGVAAAWTTSWLYVVPIGGIAVLVLVFPTGRLEGRFRNTIAGTVVAAAAIAMVSLALTPGPMDGFGKVENPIGVPGLADLLGAAEAWASTVILLSIVLALGSIVVRVRRAHGDERLQLKWFLYGALVMVLAELPNFLPVGLDDSTFGLVGLIVALVALPVAIAMAILRHRLYDIDVVIKRTLVYGSLTVLLGATYLAFVLLFRWLLEPMTGGSDLAVAASTLAVAALFRPARARVQAVVDRRFFRRRYDAALTVEAFSGRLRQEVDLNSISSDLRDVVRDTVAPTQVSLWLRGPA